LSCYCCIVVLITEEEYLQFAICDLRIDLTDMYSCEFQLASKMPPDSLSHGSNIECILIVISETTIVIVAIAQEPTNHPPP